MESSSETGLDDASTSKKESRTKSNISADDDADKTSQQEDGGAFECNICFDPAKDSVVTMCGHLFCWPCLSRWLETRGANAVCPVCKSAVSRDRCVPIYGRNADVRRDPRNSGGASSSSTTSSSTADTNSSETPRRPQGQREEPAQNANAFFGGPFTNFFPEMGAVGNGFNVSFGIGAFPFALFSTFNLGGAAGPHGARHVDGQPGESDWLLSRAFLLLAFFFLFWLVLL